MSAAMERSAKSIQVRGPTGPSDEELRKLGSALFASVAKMSAQDARQLEHVILEFSTQDVPFGAVEPLYLLADMASARGKVQ